MQQPRRRSGRERDAAGGDKNGRGPQREALERLVEQGVLEHREVALRAGKVGHEYRYKPLEEDESPNP